MTWVTTRILKKQAFGTILVNTNIDLLTLSGGATWDNPQCIYSVLKCKLLKTCGVLDIAFTHISGSTYRFVADTSQVDPSTTISYYFYEGDF